MQPPRGGGLFIGRVRQYAFTYARALPRGVYAFRATPHGPAEPRHRHMAWLIGAEAAPPRQLPRFCPPAPSAAHQSACLSSLLDSPFFSLHSFLPDSPTGLRPGDGRGREIALIGVNPLFVEILPSCLILCFLAFFLFFRQDCF